MNEGRKNHINVIKYTHPASRMLSVKKYKELGGLSFNLDNYVTKGALDGLFYMVGQEEKKIRENPAARVTDLLKQVFGSK